MTPARTTSGLARIESLRVRNYRALRDLELTDITPLTVVAGPNGSGKSTLFDVFAFLAECFDGGLRRAWDRRGRGREIRSRGSEGPVEFEIKYREAGLSPITYRLAIDEGRRGPEVVSESLRWRRGKRHGRPYTFLDFKRGEGSVIAGDTPEEQDNRINEKLDSPDLLAVSTLGQLAAHPRVSALRRYITGWYLSYISANDTRGIPEAGPQERLSKTGDNLPNVMQYLAEQHEGRLEEILEVLAERIPQLEKVETKPLDDGRLLLQLKDAPFADPVQSRWVSDGTLKMLSYLVVLYDPEPPALIGIEEPENHLHPRLLPELAEECRAAAERSQVFVSTHSPFLVNGIRPSELWILSRDGKGYTRAFRVSESERVRAMTAAGALLGDLWTEGYFNFGDPLARTGR
ncbi:AAA family ATPase [Streptomyces sp. MPA0124]|uniref:AAA family ATPase n=1 Tax=Streptomyces sp. MPA0124 TaxID=3378069 RepID=UPI00138134E0|nr:AAA family ATPase [Streptomyces sp. MS2A]MYS48742.1 AAA family ATPase [Streptomyces sp. SID6013]